MLVFFIKMKEKAVGKLVNSKIIQVMFVLLCWMQNSVASNCADYHKIFEDSQKTVSGLMNLNNTELEILFNCSTEAISNTPLGAACGDGKLKENVTAGMDAHLIRKFWGGKYFASCGTRTIGRNRIVLNTTSGEVVPLVKFNFGRIETEKIRKLVPNVMNKHLIFLDYTEPVTNSMNIRTETNLSRVESIEQGILEKTVRGMQVFDLVVPVGKRDGNTIYLGKTWIRHDFRGGQAGSTPIRGNEIAWFALEFNQSQCNDEGFDTRKLCIADIPR